MSRFELSLSPTYVQDWGIAEAVREVIQNALDEEITHKTHSFGWSYTAQEQILRISNANTKLSTSTLLLGGSSKQKDNSTVGKYGEGYKLAALVLLRTGHSFKVINSSCKELWIGKIVQSKRYQSSILAFDVVKNNNKVPDELVFEIGNVTAQDWETIQQNMLCFRSDSPKVYELPDKNKSVLLEEEERGRIYVNGLYVCTFASLHYGYNFSADMIDLDRDRHLVSDFDTKWACSKLAVELHAWAVKNNNQEIQDFVLKNIGLEEFCYINSHIQKSRTLQEVIIDRYKEAHNSAIPVSAEEPDVIKKLTAAGKQIVIVSCQEYLMLRRDPEIQQAIQEAQQQIETSISAFQNLVAVLADHNFYYSLQAQDIKKYLREIGKQLGENIPDDIEEA